ncbi:adenylate/guanylate cyclase domain-containing protein [Magnetococcus sp. PR-3]|uniref:adenylate/guanylate cyclase domain-containing protein n=1 Tax=Magnetococcus sp. PR-3 TaxID=3120355 RepID=UPI002FCDF98E
MGTDHKIKLRVGIAVAFATVMITLTTGLVSYLYMSNSTHILSTVTEFMQRSTQRISRDVEHLIAPVARVVQATTELVRTDQGRLQSVDGLGYFHRQLASLPQVYSLYVGYDATGHFYQTIQLPPSLKSLGPSKKPLPAGAQSAARLLDASSGNKADSFIIYKAWGETLAVDRGLPNYDPRKRPWYIQAKEQSGISISKAYVFASSGLVGLTVSEHVRTKSGVSIGTVGADITLDKLSSFLRDANIGESGQVFLINQEGQLVGHPNPELGFVQEEDKVRLAQADQVADPLVSGAVKAWRKNQKTQFEVELGADAATHIVAFHTMQQAPYWTVGAVVRKDELTGPLARNSIKILLAGSLVIALAIFAILMLSKLLTGPIQLIVEETKRIQAFDLTGDCSTKSMISEVLQLTDAVRTMKRSLSSFSVYVPKELVRAIVSDNQNASIGSRRQPLTVMFSDIKGFTNISEGMQPEELVHALSTYFQQMSGAIHRVDGTVDKFIGDAIMALWNAPLADENHVVHGCRGLLLCHKAGRVLAEQFVLEDKEPFITRFGLHTGEAVVGNVGSADRMQYSAFGSIINVAARLESMNKQYGTELLVSEQVVEEVGELFIFRKLDRVVPVGSTQPMYIYELIGVRDQQDPLAATPQGRAGTELWNQAYARYAERSWLEAQGLFTIYAKSFPKDPFAQVMLKRCDQFIQSPPSDAWDGTEWLEVK